MSSEQIQHDVLITGVGLVTPIGVGHADFWSALQHGESGVRKLERFASDPLPVRIGAELKEFDPKQYVRPRKSLKVMCQEIQAAVAAASLAMEQAGLQHPGEVDPERMGVVLGADMLYASLEEMEDLFRVCVEDQLFDFDQFGQGFASRVFPLWMLKYLPNMAACHISIAHDARGHCNTIVEGDISSALGLIEAAQVIRRGHADVMLTGGGGSRLILTPVVYRTSENLSHRNDDPTHASRPFDLQRDGMVNGEAAGVLVLESRQHAERRGATVLGQLHGTSVGFATHKTRDGGRGAIERTLRKCLQASGWNAEQIGHVNAHGYSTIEDDIAEAQAIANVCGNVPVVATKSNFGNVGAASSTVELAASILGMRAGLLPHHATFSHPDPQCPVHVVRDQPLASSAHTALKLGISISGQVACIGLSGPQD